MGLNTTHGAWDGAYSSFMNWRIWVAKQIGINLLEMEGFSDRDYSNPNKKRGEIKWDTIKDDLKYLLNHSDCDGSLTPKRCKKIADWLKKIIKDRKVPKDIFSLDSDEEWYIFKTKTFIGGCMKAYKEDKKLEFH